jgi:hypothetical protein
MTEHEIQNAILKRFATVSWMRLWRINTGTYLTQDGRRMVATAPPGHSDLCGVLPRGRALYIEVKAEKGRLRDEQRAWMAMVNGRGGLALVARSIADVERVLRLEGYGDYLDGKIGA